MISSHAVVETSAIGAGVSIAEFAVIRSDVVIGDGAIIHPHVVISSGVTIGSGVEIFPGAVVGKEPKGAGATARPIRFDRHVLIGDNCSIGPHAVIYYDVEIGPSTLVGDGASIREQCRVGARSIIGRYVAVNYNSTIGSQTSIMDHANITGNTRVGDRVFISMHVSMANDNTFGEAGYKGDDAMLGPVIHDDAKVGVGAILLPGIVIGRGAVVGAGAVVHRSVPDYVMVVGVPSREHKQLGRRRPRGEA